MLFLNDKEQIIKYKDEMLKINPQITEMVAKYAGVFCRGSRKMC